MTKNKVIVGMIVNKEEKKNVTDDAIKRNMSVSDHLRTSVGLPQNKVRKESWASRKQ